MVFCTSFLLFLLTELPPNFISTCIFPLYRESPSRSLLSQIDSSSNNNNHSRPTNKPDTVGSRVYAAIEHMVKADVKRAAAVGVIRPEGECHVYSHMSRYKAGVAPEVNLNLLTDLKACVH